jgi:hypothetical protein
MLNTVRTFITRRPLLFVMLASAFVRLLSVVWSRGFIHNDDYFETVVISHDWLASGIFGHDGYLHWLDQTASEFTRFPLYTLAVSAVMRLENLCGLQSLDSMMYGVRFVHALLSMLPVICTFQVVKLVTRDDRWAVFGGLFAGFYFAAPFLGVRNLIEIVGGEIWIVAIWAFYRYADEPHRRWLYVAGIMTGLAWMVRFQIAFAALPIPFVLWYERKSIRDALHYSAAVAMMILIAWTADYFLLGRFAGTSLTYLNPKALYDTIYNTIPGLYLVVLLALFIPPFSFILVWLAGRPSFIRKHRLLVFSTLSFLLCHWFLRNQQERFIFPMIPAFILMFSLALWDRWLSKGFILASRKTFIGIATFAVLVNLVGLILLTTSYGHRGLIEPVVRLSETDPSARVVYLYPNTRTWIPTQYGATTMTQNPIRNWQEWTVLKQHANDDSPPDFFVLYPNRQDSLSVCLDSVQAAFGSVEPVFHVEPSVYDHLLHSLNPRHNDDFEAYVYRRAAVGKI